MEFCFRFTEIFIYKFINLLLHDVITKNYKVSLLNFFS